jgi:hypothetical protein
MARTHPQPPTSQQHVLVNDEPHLGVSWQPLGSEADAPILGKRVCVIHGCVQSMYPGSSVIKADIPSLRNEAVYHVSLVDVIPKAKEKENCSPPSLYLGPKGVCGTKTSMKFITSGISNVLKQSK